MTGPRCHTMPGSLGETGRKCREGSGSLWEAWSWALQRAEHTQASLFPGAGTCAMCWPGQHSRHFTNVLRRLRTKRRPNKTQLQVTPTESSLMMITFCLWLFPLGNCAASVQL